MTAFVCALGFAAWTHAMLGLGGLLAKKASWPEANAFLHASFFTGALTALVAVLI